MSAHRPGDHSREIDVTHLREWIAADRPGAGVREWRYPLDGRPDQTGATPSMTGTWPFLPVLAIFAAVVVVAVLLSAYTYVLEQQPTGYARPMAAPRAGWWR